MFKSWRFSKLRHIFRVVLPFPSDGHVCYCIGIPTLEEANNILREAGYDPVQVGRDGAEFAKQMSKKYS